MFYPLQWEILKSRKLRRAYAESGRLPTIGSYLLQAWLDGNANLPVLHKALADGLPVSKLNWRLNMPPEEFDLRLGQVMPLPQAA